MGTMNTFSGKKFDPVKMTVEDICLEDIGHALSLLCRGGWHLKYFYSVGQHSVNCMKEAEARGWSKRVQLACLLHDASEAYLSDIIRPVKENLVGYLELENRIMEKVLERFGLDDLSEEEKRKWKQIDDDMLNFELRVLMGDKEEGEAVKMYSEPAMEEKRWQEVEKEFVELAVSLAEL
jgi:5'-deoxynucleotidase YfbR-like HD superfamily hydrolase